MAQTKEARREYYLKNKERIKEQKRGYDKKRYQQNKERLTKQVLAWREKNMERYEEARKKRLNSEKGFMKTLWQSIKDSGKHNSFKDFDEFYNHWLEQKSRYGMKCPATGIEMTTNAVSNEKGNFRRCDTNISKDRILSFMGYSRQNLIFTSWKYNRAKGDITPDMAKAFLDIVYERYGPVEDIE